MSLNSFYEQAKLLVETKNEFGAPASWLMQNWNDLTKDELAHIAIEALIAGESACERENFHIQPASDEAVVKFYDELMENLEFYLPEDEE